MLISQLFSVWWARFLLMVPWLLLLSNGFQAVRHAPGYRVLPLWLVNMQNRYFSSTCDCSNLMLSCQLPAMFVNDLQYQWVKEFNLSKTPYHPPSKKHARYFTWFRGAGVGVILAKYIESPPPQNPNGILDPPHCCFAGRWLRWVTVDVGEVG